MKRLKGVWEKSTSYSALYRAFKRAGAAKWDRPAIVRFELELESELLALQADLLGGNYWPGAYRQFVIRDRKPRVISAAPFRDRVVHHALMAEVEPWLDARFIHHTYACRREKGAHKAVDYYQQKARRYAYVLKLDLARYFPSIRRDLLIRQLQHHIAEPNVLQVLERVVFSGPGEGLVGIPIGNLTSQVFANLYLNDIDHWIQQDARCGAYLRYVDDLFLLGDDKQQLWSLLGDLRLQLEALGLAIHPRKCTLAPTRLKTDILGYQVSRQQRWLRNDNGYRAQRRIQRVAQAYARGEVNLAETRQRVVSWLGHAQHAQCGGLIKSILGNVRFQRNAAV